MVDQTLEFSFPIEIAHANSDGRTYHLEPTDPQRAAIAKRLGVLASSSMSGEVTVTRVRGGLALTGHCTAMLRRECVASLEELDEKIDETFEIIFQRNAPEPEESELTEAPEPLEGEEIDIGEIFVQQISLAMDPFPRKKDAESLADQFGSDDDPNPFAELFKQQEKMN